MDRLASLCHSLFPTNSGGLDTVKEAIDTILLCCMPLDLQDLFRLGAQYGELILDR
jgi:hypothetical protein